MGDDADFNDQVRRSLVGAWHRYVAILDPIRPDLFRYCRQLTGNLWDAEDLVQETLLRGFAQLSQILYTIKSPRAYILRIATNLWIDRLRAGAVEQATLATVRAEQAAAGTPSVSPSQGPEVRDAAATLMERLPPRERAAVLLSEVFDLRLEETASILGTTVGAVKAALHRGRERLAAHPPTPARRPKPPRELLDRFVERYNARDLPGLLALMADDATIGMGGFHTEIGREGFERERGWFHHNFFSPIDGSPTQARWEVVEFEGEQVVIVFGGMADESTLTSVMRLEGEDGRLRRILVYALCPDVIREIGMHFGHRTQDLGYRFPFDMSGAP